MSNLVMKIESRDAVGSNEVKKLRVENLIPGVIYSKGEETKTVSIDAFEFQKIYVQAGSSSVVDLELNGETVPVVIKDVQKHPFKNQVVHIDFQKVNMHEKIRMNIPIVLLNRDNIRLQPSTLVQQMNEVEIECLPSYLPKTADVDVEHIDFTEPKYVKDLDIASFEGVTMLTDLDEIVCSLIPPTVEEEEDELGEEAAQPEVIGEDSQE